MLPTPTFQLKKKEGENYKKKKNKDERLWSAQKGKYEIEGRKRSSRLAALGPTTCSRMN